MRYNSSRISANATIEQEIKPVLELRRPPQLPMSALAAGGFDRGPNDLTIEDVRNVFRTYRRMLYATVLVFLLMATAYSIVAKRRYASVGELELEKSEISALDSMGNATQGVSTAEVADATDFALTQPTQV